MENENKNRETVWSKMSIVIVERLMQLVFWVGLGYMLIVHGLPLFGDTLVDFYHGIKNYYADAPASETVAAGAGWFFW